MFIAYDSHELFYFFPGGDGTDRQVGHPRQREQGRRGVQALVQRHVRSF